MRCGGWRLSGFVALLNFTGMRALLRMRNLHDTQTLPQVDPDRERPSGLRWLSVRTADGTYNDLATPRMGSAGTRFSRNFALEAVHPDENRLLTPNVRFAAELRRVYEGKLEDVDLMVGLYIDDNTMSTVLLRHVPARQPSLARVKNAFAPWPGAGR